MPLPALLTAIGLYAGVALAGLGAGVVVNALANRVQLEEASATGHEQSMAGSAKNAHAGEADGPEVADVLPTSRDWRKRSRSIRHWATPLALGAIFPLLLAHLVASASATPVQSDTTGALPLWAVFALQAISVAALMGIFIVDLEHRLILDVVVFPLGGGLLAVALLFARPALLALLVGMALAGGLFLVFYGLGYLLYRQEAMGFGDVKLAAVIGLLGGWPAITTALLATAVIGAIVSLLLLGFGAVGRRTFIPFGIFLVLGAICALLTAQPVW